MKIIFTQDVKKQGKKGEIKEVKDGFANYLIQQKVAVVASDVNLGRLERANANKKAMDDMNRELAKKEGYIGRIVFPLVVNYNVVGFMIALYPLFLIFILQGIIELFDI